MKKNSLFYISVILFPVGTLIASIPTIGTLINKILLILLFIGLFSFFKKMTKKSVIYFMSVIFLVIFDLVITNFPLYNFNEVFYLFVWVVFLNCFFEHWEEWFENFYHYRKLIISQAILWNALTFVSFFVESCYEKDRTFGSWAGGMHRLDSSALLMAGLVLYLYIIEKNKKLFLYLIVPGIAVLISGARTYLVVFLVAFIMIIYQIAKQKWKFWLTIVPLVALVVMWILSTEVMQNRMNLSDFVLQRDGFWGAVTSGRSIFWVIDIKEFFHSPLLNQFLGNGFNFIRETNERLYGEAIWAHNDFINLLGCNGYIGVFLYWVTYVRAISVHNAISSKKRGTVLKLLLLHFVCVFNAMFNMLYTYQSAVFAIPFLIYFLWSEDLNINSIGVREH